MNEENVCAECSGDTSDCHIYIMQNLKSDEELTICSECRTYYNWTGWIDDQELEDLAEHSLKEVSV